MNMYRRNNFKDWFADVGFIYLVVVLFVSLIFIIRSIHHVPQATWDESAGLEKATADLVADEYGNSR